MPQIYRVDVTQSVDPASTNFGTLARGEEARAEGVKYGMQSTTTLLKAAETAVKAGVEIDLERTNIKAEEASQEFLQSNKEAGEAFQQLSSLAKPSEFAIDQKAEWAKYDSEFRRLRTASLGGMSNSDYVTRVSALSREAIARYPGLSDKIRERVGTITGLPYADRWEEMQFIKERFAKQQSKAPVDPLDFVKKDIENTERTGVSKLSQEQLWALFNTDKPKYNEVTRLAREHSAAQVQTDTVKKALDVAVVQSDKDINIARSGVMGIYSGALGLAVVGNTFKDNETIYAPMAQEMAKGNNLDINPDAFLTHIKLHNASMRTSIYSAADAAHVELQKLLAKPENVNVSEAKRREMEKDIDNARDRDLLKYADDKGVGAVAMATIMVGHKDKTLKEKREAFDLLIKQQTAMQNNEMVKAYNLGGAARENLEKSQPHFYAFMVKQEKQMQDLLLGITTESTVDKDLATVNKIITDARTNAGKPVSTTGVDPATAKAAHEVMHNNAINAIDKHVKGLLLTPEEGLLISSAFATSVKDGGNSRVLAADHVKLGAKIKLLPDNTQAIIKGNISNASIENVQTLASKKAAVEAVYGVKIQLGVNDAGYILAMPTGIGQQKAGLTGKSANARIIASQAEASAINEFNNATKALSSNLVHGRVMLTAEDKKTVAFEYASLINGNQPYKGFFSMSPVAPSTGATKASIDAAIAAKDVAPAATTTSSNPAQWWKQ